MDGGSEQGETMDGGSEQGETMDGGSASELDGAKCADEIRTYNEVHAYLANKTYPVNTTKAEKGVIRKRSKNFSIIEGVLHYSGKSGLRQVRPCISIIMLCHLLISSCMQVLTIVQVVTELQTKCRIVEACHDDKVGGCHFGRDKTADKVSSRFYWKRINSDVDDWVRYTYIFELVYSCTSITDD